MAGYSGTPLAQKLGIKAGHRVALLGAPADFHTMLALPNDVSVERSLGGKKPFDVIVLFAMAERDLARRFVPTAKRLQHDGGFWVAWPKKASGVATDVTENTVRGVALAAGLVDNKVCAMDDTWSGLRCVIRVADRPKASRGTRAPAKQR
jgi:hypothetical protein